MKKLLFIGSILWGIAACAGPQICKIKGELPGATDGTIVKLMDQEDYPPQVIDSAIVKDGKFILQCATPFENPRYCRLVVDNTPLETNERKKELKAYSFFADNVVIFFQCPVDSMPSYYWDAVNKEHNVKLVGGPTQELYNRYRASVKDISIQKRNLWNQYLEVYHRPASDGVFNTKEGMEIVRQSNAVARELNQAIMQFIRENNSSVVSLLLAQHLLGSGWTGLTVDEINTVVNGFAPSLQNSRLMKNVKRYGEEALSVAKGVNYLDIELTDLDGKKVKLSEYVKPGEYNMLEFWASWCGPCRGEIPHLRHLYEVCGKDRFNMISISIDEKDSDWKKAVKEENMEWTQLCDQLGDTGPVRTVYNVNGVPFCLILDKEGKIVGGGVRGAQLDLALTELLGEEIKGL